MPRTMRRPVVPFNFFRNNRRNRAAPAVVVRLG
jgi:hypothetical protein